MATVATQYWHRLDDGRVQCDLCPRSCKLREGQRGLCFVRSRQGDEIVLTAFGKTTGLAIDPIEKKPLSHFLPGTEVLSFGTAGCNLACRFCQNWSISKARDDSLLAVDASPSAIVDLAVRTGCRSVAFTYNDPVIFHEYAIAVAEACRPQGIKTVAVSAGYVNPEPRAEFYRHIDAANIDLKSYTDEFYRRLCAGRLEPVLDTLEYIHRETDVWLEITTLLIPGYNDSPTEIEALAVWIRDHLSPDVPLHFSAFHPDFRMMGTPSTRPDTLQAARFIAMDEVGLRHVYTGNVYDPKGQATYCAGCGAELIGRTGYSITRWGLDQGGRCAACGTRCPGVFEPEPGTWSGRSMPVWF